MRKIFKILGMGLSAALIACGGGGGNPGGSGGNTGGGGDGSSGGGGNAISGKPSVVVSIVNPSNVVVTKITAGGGFQARAVVKDSDGAAVANKLVAFGIEGSTIATLTQDSALTDAAGIAMVPITPSSIAVGGAATLTATVGLNNNSGVLVEEIGKTDFAVTAAGLLLSPISVASPNISSGGNTTLSVTANVNGAALTGTPVNVAFSVSCGRINGLDASSGGVSVTTNGSGVASAAYNSVGIDGSLCSGPVQISAFSAGAQATAATIQIAAPVANAVAFMSASPAQIFVAGSGATEQSLVIFKVLAASGTPLPNTSVVFSILTNPGGVGLNAAGAMGDVTATTDQAGQASVSVYSGTIPGPVKVRATLASDASVFSESQNLTVASGPPSQRFMSLSMSTTNIEGWIEDGTPTQLTVRVADRQGNAVADGTVVNFTAEGGQVANSCATIMVNKISSCSVDFVSQNPRPLGGRVSVLAYLAGTKDYDDNDNNNIYNAGDTLRQIGDAYRDDNENDIFDVTEFVVPRGGSLACNGTGGAFPSRANTCANGLATTVRQAAVILYSSSEPIFSSISASTSEVSFSLGSFNNPLLPMPAGTTVTATPLADGCTVMDIAGSPVVNVRATPGAPAEVLNTLVSIALKGCAANQRVNIKVTAPSGLVTSSQITLQ